MINMAIAAVIITTPKFTRHVDCRLVDIDTLANPTLRVARFKNMHEQCGRATEHRDDTVATDSRP